MAASRFRLLGMIAATAIAVGACSSSATASPTAAPTPTPAASASAAATTVAAASPTAAPLPVVPATDLITAGTLTVCSDTSYPPQENLDSNNQPVGADIDLIKAVGAKLSLTVVIKPTNFNSIIPALTGGTCDIIVSAQTITADRQAQVDMIPYFQAGQEFVVLTGNPENIAATTDLCGKAVAAESGTVEADHIGGTGGYKTSGGLTQACVAAGKQPITLKTFTADTQALLALQANTVVAHFTDEPVAGYEVAHGNGAYAVVPNLDLEKAPEGISVGKNHTGLRDAIAATLNAMIADGSYLQILTTWGIQSGAVTSANP
jgi:polar amino acid transport system substrate-binding protein